MIVGIRRITLHLPGNRSLKGKRKIVRKICDRVKHRFSISIAEIGDLNLHQRSQIGYTIISNEEKVVQSLMTQIQEFIEALQLAPILNLESEVIHFGDNLGETLYSPEDQQSDGWDYMDEWKK